LIVKRAGIKREQAYTLCSLAADLRGPRRWLTATMASPVMLDMKVFGQTVARVRPAHQLGALPHRNPRDGPNALLKEGRLELRLNAARYDERFVSSTGSSREVRRKMRFEVLDLQADR